MRHTVIIQSLRYQKRVERVLTLNPFYHALPPTLSIYSVSCGGDFSVLSVAGGGKCSLRKGQYCHTSHAARFAIFRLHFLLVYCALIDIFWLLHRHLPVTRGVRCEETEEGVLRGSTPLAPWICRPFSLSGCFPASCQIWREGLLHIVLAPAWTTCRVPLCWSPA